MNRIQVAARFALLLALAGARTDAYSASYVTRDLTPAGFGSVSTPAQIIGMARNQQVGFGMSQAGMTVSRALLWSGYAETYVELTPPGHNGSAAYGTDGTHQVGYVTGLHAMAAMWSGTAASYANLHPSSFNETYAYGVSGSQQVGTGDGHALLWNGTADSWVDLNPTGAGFGIAYATDGVHQVGAAFLPPGATSSKALRAMLWSGSAASAVDLSPAGMEDDDCYAKGVAGSEQVGYYIRGRAIVWHGTRESAIILHPSTGYTATYAYATNGVQQVGVAVGPLTGGVNHAVVWTGAAASMVDLHAFLPAGYTDSRAFSIDPDGVIGGTATIGGAAHAVMWLPVGGSVVHLAASDVDGQIGETIGLSAKLTLASNGSPIAGETLRFVVNGSQVGLAVTGTDGEAALPYVVQEDVGAGDRHITVLHDQSGSYAPCSASSTLTVVKADSTLALTSLSAAASQPVSLRAQLTYGSLPITGRTISFAVDGNDAGTGTTGADGVAVCAYNLPAGLTLGAHNVTATFAGDGAFNASTLTEPVLAVKIAASISLYAASGGLRSTINLRCILAAGGKRPAGKVVSFAVDGQTVGSMTTDSNGLALLSWTIPIGIGAGVHRLAATFAGDDTYAPTTREANALTVSKAKTGIGIYSVYASVGSYTVLRASLACDAGVVQTRYLTFTVDGTPIGGALTLIDGVAQCGYTVPSDMASGVHTMTVKFDGSSDPVYGSSSRSVADLTVTKAISTLNVHTTSGTAGSIVTLGCDLTSSTTPVTGKTITFTIDGTSVGSAKTSASGVAGLTYRIPSSLSFGPHTVAASFAGDASYLPTWRGNGGLTVLRTVAFSLFQVSGAPGSAVSLKTLVYSGGSAVSDLTVQFAVDAKTVGSADSDSNGATLPYTIPSGLSAGVHNVTVSFAVNSTYGAVSRTTAALTVTIPKANVSFSQYASSGSPGQTLALRTLVYIGGAPVTGLSIQFAVDGTPAGSATSDTSGASLSYTVAAGLSPGTHTVTVSFAGDATHNAATRTTAALTVK